MILDLNKYKHKLFVYVDIRKGIIYLLSLFIIFFLLSIDNAVAQQLQQQQQPQLQTTQGVPIVFIPAVTGNILAVVSFLIGTSSFILGLRIQSAARTTTTESSSSATLPSSEIHKYFELLILAMVIPAIGLNTYGILILASHLYLRDSPYHSFLLSSYLQE